MRTRWPARTMIVLGVVAAALAMTRAEARAQAEQADCTFIEIKASNTGGGVDKRLAPLQRKLARPPFSSWNTFEQLGKHQREVTRMRAEDVKLAIGGRLSALYRDRIQAKGRKDRLRMTVTMDDKSGKRALDTTFGIDSGEYLLIGGQALPDDATYVLAISCAVK
jgi:hypothetical protein